MKFQVLAYKLQWGLSNLTYPPLCFLHCTLQVLLFDNHTVGIINKKLITVSTIFILDLTHFWANKKIFISLVFIATNTHKTLKKWRRIKLNCL